MVSNEFEQLLLCEAVRVCAHSSCTPAHAKEKRWRLKGRRSLPNFRSCWTAYYRNKHPCIRVTVGICYNMYIQNTQIWAYNIAGFWLISAWGSQNKDDGFKHMVWLSMCVPFSFWGCGRQRKEWVRYHRQFQETVLHADFFHCICLYCGRVHDFGKYLYQVLDLIW